MQMAPAPPADSDDRFAADLLAVILGDSTGSRIFWELVDPGLVETAELGYQEFHGAGAFVTYLCCSPELAQDNLRRVREIYRTVTRTGVTPDELTQAKGKTAARLVLRSERPMGRLMPLGFNWSYRGQYRSLQDDLQTLQAVSLSDIRRVLDQYPLQRVTTVTLGPLKEMTFDDDQQP
jgi:predicted Zn-dependent peptidase